SRRPTHRPMVACDRRHPFSALGAFGAFAALAGFAAFSALGAFLTGAAFVPDFPLVGATSGLCLPARAFLSGCCSTAATAADGGVHVHDLQATILHVLGIDREKLTYLFQGRQFRLTDVGGRVVKEILA